MTFVSGLKDLSNQILTIKDPITPRILSFYKELELTPYKDKVNYNKFTGKMSSSTSFPGFTISSPTAGHKYRVAIISDATRNNVEIAVLNQSNNTTRASVSQNMESGKYYYADFTWNNAWQSTDHFCFTTGWMSADFFAIYDITDYSSEQLALMPYVIQHNLFTAISGQS